MLGALATFAIVTMLLAWLFRALTPRPVARDGAAGRAPRSQLATLATSVVVLVVALAVTYVVLLIVVPLILIALVLRTVAR